MITSSYVVCFITTGTVDDVIMRIVFGVGLAVSNKFTTKISLLSSSSTLTGYDRSLITEIITQIWIGLGFQQ